MQKLAAAVGIAIGVGIVLAPTAAASHGWIDFNGPDAAQKCSAFITNGDLYVRFPHMREHERIQECLPMGADTVRLNYEDFDQ